MSSYIRLCMTSCPASDKKIPENDGAGIDAYIIPVYADSDSAGHLQLKIIIVFLAEILA